MVVFHIMCSAYSRRTHQIEIELGEFGFCWKGVLKFQDFQSDGSQESLLQDVSFLIHQPVMTSKAIEMYRF